VEAECAAFLPDGAKGPANQFGDFGVREPAQKKEFIFCPWSWFALHAFRLSLLRHLHSNFAWDIGMSSNQNVDYGRSFLKRMLSIKIPLRQHCVVDEPPV